MTVKKIRVITRRKLKMTYSQWATIYMHAGMGYVQNVVKTGMNSLRKASLSVTSQGSFSISSVHESTFL